RVPGCPHRLAPLATHLETQRDAVLAFARALDADLGELARAFRVPVELVREVLQVEALEPRRPARWQRQAVLRQRLRGCFYPLQQAGADLARQTVRARSVVENLNSRLRGYFFLRRQF